MTALTGTLGRTALIVAFVFSFAAPIVVIVDSIWKAATPYSYDGSHRRLVEYVKERMHDPDSFQHVQTYVAEANDGNMLVVMTYRGANGFGAIRRTTCMALIYADGRILMVDENDVRDYVRDRND